MSWSRSRPCRETVLGTLCLMPAWLALWTMPCAAQSTDTDRLRLMESRLQSRIAANPDDAASWRLLGRIRLEQDQPKPAFQAFQRAVELDPNSAAARFDLGRIQLQRDQPKSAARSFYQAVFLAPDSNYARDARTFLEQIKQELGETEFTQIGYEVQRFDGSDTAKSVERTQQAVRQTPRQYYLRLESGAVYNSNVALAPIDRQLTPGTRASFQGFLAPELEYFAFNREDWVAGPSFRGHFNLNEGGFRNFNLQNYQPGFFIERIIDHQWMTWVPRLQYEFTHDEFEGHTFGNRHALTTSATAFWIAKQATFFYWTIDNTNFTADGNFPSVTSRDGWTNSLGVSHSVELARRHLQLVRAGVDFQRADVDGSDFAFNGVNLYGEAEMPLLESVLLVLQLGWGYRDYYNFEFSPSRNEHIWRAGMELRKRINDQLFVAAVFNYNRFDSRNVLFEADRYVTGVVLTYERN